jgi:hypothetical protein
LPTKKAAANDGLQRLEHLLGLARRIGSTRPELLLGRRRQLRRPALACLGDIQSHRKLHLRQGFTFDSTYPTVPVSSSSASSVRRHIALVL